MKRYVGITLEHSTSINDITSITNKIFPKWSYANNFNSITHTDISESLSDINSLSYITEKYKHILEYGGIFDHHTLWVTNSDIIDSTENYYDFISQIPTSYILQKTLKLDRNNLSSLISYETSIDLEKEHILFKGYDDEKTFYIYSDFNHKIINEYYINEKRKTISLFPYIEPIENISFITNNKNIQFVENDKVEIFYKVNNGYNKKIDINNDGYISESDVILYCQQNNFDYEKYKYIIGTVKKTGYYAKYIEPTDIEYYETNYNGILDQSINIQDGQNIKKAIKHVDNNIIKLTIDGILYIDNFNINSKISSDEYIINFDVYGDRILFISNNDNTITLYSFSVIDNSIQTLIETKKKYNGITCCPDDYIYLYSENEIDVYKPYYTTPYYKDDSYYYLSNINDILEQKIELKSIKLYTYIDYIGQIIGVERWFGESLYNFFGRFKHINNIEQIEYNNILSEHLSILPKTVYKPIYTTYINQVISEIHPNSFIEINSSVYQLKNISNEYYYNDTLVFTFKNKILTVYDSINRIPSRIKNGTYIIFIGSDSGLNINFKHTINNINFEYISDIEINNVDESNVINSSVIFNKNFDSIYKTKDSYSNIVNGLTEFDSFNSSRFDYQGKYVTKYDDEFTYTLPKTENGIWDGYSFGDQEILNIKTVIPSDVQVLNGDYTIQDENTLMEISNEGSNQIVKFSCNSGYAVDNGTIKLYGSFSNDSSSYFRKINFKQQTYDNFVSDSPKVYIDDNNFSYMNYNDIKYKIDKNNDIYTYDNTGRLELYIQKQLLSTGPVYITLKTKEFFSGKIQLMNKVLTCYNTTETLPKPMKIEVIYDKKKKTEYLYESSKRYFNDSYFNVFSTTVSNSLVNNIPTFSREPNLTENKKTLYIDDRNNKEIDINITETGVTSDDLLRAKLNLCDIYIDDMIVDKSSITSQYESWFEYIKTFSQLYKFDLIQTNHTSIPPAKEIILNSANNIIPSNMFVFDCFLFLHEYFNTNTAGFEYHYKDNFEKCYIGDNELKEYLFLNNLLNTTSHAYIQLSNVGAFKKDQKYTVICIVAPTKAVTLYE